MEFMMDSVPLMPPRPREEQRVHCQDGVPIMRLRIVRQGRSAEAGDAAAPGGLARGWDCTIADAQLAAAGRGIACSSRDNSVIDGWTATSRSSPVDGRMVTLDVVDVQLSFVPSWFWAPDLAYTVKAVGEGLVCISNANRDREAPRRPTGHVERYCVLNPVTRACQVLPRLPFHPAECTWLPLTATTVTIYRGAKPFISTWVGDPEEWRVATYDLTTGVWLSAAAVAVVRPPPMPGLEPGWEPQPHLAQCGGHVYWQQDRLRLRVLPLGPLGRPPSPSNPAASHGQLAVDGPSVAQLGLEAASINYVDGYGVKMVAHRGALYFVAQLMQKSEYNRFEDHVRDVVCGVWRLAHGRDSNRMEWEPVARLGMDEVERITGLLFGEDEDANVFDLCDAYGARELLCCLALVHHFGYTTDGSFSCGSTMSVLLGFNLDTRQWELVCEPGAEYSGACTMSCMAVELRPDLE